MDAPLNRDVAELRVHLRTALVADALDAIGRRNQCLGSGILPLQSNVVLVGRAFTVSAIPADHPASPPYVGLLKALGEIKAGEVFIYPTGRSNRAAVWGELVSAACLARGVVGLVGKVVDIDGVRITPGDLVIADDDGVVIVPADIEAEVIERSLVKDAQERRFREAVEHGDSALVAFERFDVL